jgi:hypothetical protein
MIYLLVTNRGSHTFRDYLQDWAGDLAAKMTLLMYENYLHWPPEASGTYIFSDLERLTDAQLAIVRDCADRLQKSIPAALIINHPKHALRRFDLLKTLHETGINSFKAYPLLQVPNNVRFPVFLRFARDHNGPCSQLIPDRNALMLATLGLAAAGFRLDELLAIEYCDTCPADGWFRKYSSFRFGDRIIAAHVIYRKDWIVKDGGEHQETYLREEEETYIRSNPHEEFIRQIFDLAKIQYGRIDYSMLGDKPQVWEINTNPILLKSRAAYEAEAPSEIPLKQALSSIIGGCLNELDTAGDSYGRSAERKITATEFLKLLNWI